MNTQIITCVNPFIKVCLGMALMFSWTSMAHADWSIDFSRRASKTREADLNAAGRANDARHPASVRSASADGSGEGHGDGNAMVDFVPKATAKKGVFDTLFDAGEPVQDLVVLHTEKGFVPATLRVRKNGRYRIHIVNVNEKEKNVSFILDGFSEHHATYYGKIKNFILEPKKEGAFSFQSPETSSEGKLVVFNPQMNLRAPASEE